MMQKLKIVFLALLASAIGLAVFLAIVKVAVFLSVVIMLFLAFAIVYFVAKFWPPRK